MALRIALVTTDAYGALGGIATYNRDLVDALVEMPDVDEVIVVPRTPAATEPAIPPKVRVLEQAAGGKARFVATALSCSLERVDLLICGHINLLPVAGPLRLALGCPLALIVYGIDAWREPSRSARMWLRQVSAVWSISAITRERMNQWAKLPDSMYTLLPNAIRLERYGVRPKSRELMTRYRLEGRKVLMTLGRLSSAERYKGVDEVLDVMPALLRDDPTLTYLVVGDGDDRTRLEQKARDLGIERDVVFSGFVREDEKVSHYCLADAFVMPSRGEGFGFVFLEAMACGVPVVGSLVDGSREALRDGMLGELVNPAVGDSIVAGVRRALSKGVAVQPGLDYFTWSSYTDRVRVVLSAILTPAPMLS